MSKQERCRIIVRSMTDEERRELIDWMQEELCPRCAALVADEAAFEEHLKVCPFPPMCLCGHADREHDEDDPDGKCLAKDEKGKRCDCPGFEDEDEEDEDEEDEDDEEDG
jgi:hypothetical protein